MRDVAMRESGLLALVDDGAPLGLPPTPWWARLLSVVVVFAVAVAVAVGLEVLLPWPTSRVGQFWAGAWMAYALLEVFE